VLIPLFKKKPIPNRTKPTTRSIREVDFNFGEKLYISFLIF
jgi:hypothetical protein